ncbi:peptidase S8 [Paenibacillaceae bacterium]|nr:peptidase S8 [Paenibacillaceae bacterium]
MQNLDTIAFLRWLHSLTNNHPGRTGSRCIIRFHNQQYYRQLIYNLSKMKKSLSSQQQIRPLPLIRALSCRLPEGVSLSFLKGMAWMEEDRSVQLHSIASKSVNFSKGIPWGVQHIKAPMAWSSTTGHRVKIGVIDTGVDFQHSDLRQSLARGINLINRNQPPHDDNGHGTHIAGTIAAANMPRGMIGVAPRATIYPVKAFDHNGSAYVSDIILGIEWCVRNRMHIVNMSFGMKTRSKPLLNAVTNAYNAGVVVVASSGNDGKLKSIDYPARYPQTISVGATNRLRRVAPFSNRGSYIDIYAPGDKIVSAWLNDKYHEMSGTSMATSHVSGAIALLLAEHPGLSPAEIKTALRRSMQPLRGKKAPRLTGELDVMKMLQAAEHS